jgi:tRNA threonylcarbamoyladenosine dehydratase
MSELDIKRRFGGVSRLYGEAGLAKFQAAHVVVIGIGGVGSWAAEALARNAIGNITLIDLDNIAESNVNRQLHAVEAAFGKAKVTAMRERILSINPICKVREIEDFITVENVAKLLDFSLEMKVDVIVDCIDDAAAKAALAAFCKQHKTALIMTGGAGGRLDATKIKTADLAKVTNDRLLAKVRNLLRRDYAFAKGEKTQFNINCVYSDEPVIKPDAVCEPSALLSDTSITGLNCAGYGSSVCVTAPFGFVAAGLALQQLLKI